MGKLCKNYSFALAFALMLSPLIIQFYANTLNLAVCDVITDKSTREKNLSTVHSVPAHQGACHCLLTPGWSTAANLMFRLLPHLKEHDSLNAVKKKKEINVYIRLLNHNQ